MAIANTREARQSISGGNLPFLGPGVTPNASKDAEWRQQVSWNYSGIELSTIPGLLTATEPGTGKYSRIAGYAISSTVFRFQPSETTYLIDS